MRDFFQVLIAHKTVIDPANDAIEGLLVGEQGKIISGLEAMVARLPGAARLLHRRPLISP